MAKGKITWSSGKSMEFECEDLEAYKVSWFGSGGIPMDVKFEVYDEEKENAVEIGTVQEGDLGEYQEGNGSGEAERSGSGDSSVEGGEEDEDEEEVIQPKSGKKKSK